MPITYTTDHYIKGLNIHSVRDLFLPARVSADLDLTFRRQSKKSRLSKKAFLLLAFLEAAEGFTYSFDAHFAEYLFDKIFIVSILNINRCPVIFV